MPNHVTNVIIMKNITQLPFFSEYEESKENDPKIFFDFNKIIPMPEELQIISGSIENIAVEMAIRFYDKNGEGLREYHQYSDEEFIRGRKNYTETDLELADIGLKYLSNVVKYSASNWYVWREKNWGTKWNSYQLEIINKDCIRFQTAWYPPIPILIELSQMNPKTQITHYWCDEFIGNGSGYFEYNNGIIVRNESANNENENHPSKYTSVALHLSNEDFSYNKKSNMNLLLDDTYKVA